MDIQIETSTDVTKTVHRAPYPAISPTRPELSQRGKAVLISGGATGIGRAIARAFVQASASTVIIVGRRPGVLAEGVQHLEAEAKKSGSETHVIAQSCDVTSAADVDALWAGLAEKGIHVDVLVANAAKFATPGKLLELDRDEFWSLYETNVRGPLLMGGKFYRQEGKKTQKFLINISTHGTHVFDHPMAKDLLSYSLTKNAGTLLHQLVAHETPVEEMQVVNVHPGTVYSPAWAAYGIPDNPAVLDAEDLPGQWAVWGASPEARFLHGRFVWASWDVDELKTGPLRKRIDEDYNFLRIGVGGLYNGHLVSA